MSHVAVAPACAAQYDATILENRPLARDTYLLRLQAPELARTIRPGQFVMLRPTATLDPLLGRPFALYDVAFDLTGKPFAIDVVYLVLGRGTATLSHQHTGARLSVWGPLGNGFGPPPRAPGPIAFVAGGIGQTPFLALAKWWRGTRQYDAENPLPHTTAADIRLYYGVRDASLLAGVDDFKNDGLDVQISTDNGSAGTQGFTTDLLAADIDRGQQPVHIIGCGPPPMLAALTRLADRHHISCDLSLENHMACGFGACFSCVAPIRRPDRSIDLKRVCVEGPVFPAQSVVH
jgi:dihydroorotate dehydrogenase electron transfer subunit